MSGSPIGATGIGGGGAGAATTGAALGLRLKNIRDSTHADMAATPITPDYGCYPVKFSMVFDSGEVLLTSPAA
jgi:hypothetical protein